MSTPRVLVIGLDGADFNLLGPMMEAGQLPALKALADSGVTGPLRSTVLPTSPAAWSSFATGKNPGKHRIFEFIRRVPRTYEVVTTLASDRAGVELWELLSQHGKRVGVLNVPYTYPPRSVNGFMLSGFTTPNHGCNYSYPEDLKSELVEQFGGYRIHLNEMYSESNVETFVRDLERLTEHRTQVAQYLMKHKPWDFFMVVFVGTDRITHALYRHLDPSHRWHSPQEAKRWQPRIAGYFMQIDRCVARLLDAIDDNTIVMIVSDHGMHSFSEYLHLNNYLLSRGVIRLKRTWRTRIRRLLHRMGVTPENFYRLFSKIHLRAAPERMKKGSLRRINEQYSLSFEDVDWSRTKAYQAAGGFIYINLKGREPNGCVSPGVEYNRIRKALVKELEKLKHPQTGESIIEKAWLREEAYHGEYADEGPDVLYLPKPPFSRSRVPGSLTDYHFTSNQLVSSPLGISGDHSMNGIFFLAGPGIKQGIKNFKAHIIDCVPTILYAMGLGIPGDIDGRVLLDAFEPEVQTQRSPQIVPAVKMPRDHTNHLSEEETEQIKERLRAFGYIG